ncbi:virginiamycin B lyase family protein [Nocardioides sp. LHG3406-4]|uniref:Vgb family protein n=1 Tax=Nocardioides sp. LHG3406-4 TaxID=2804575 RepID=UPI003CE835B3
MSILGLVGGLLLTVAPTAPAQAAVTVYPVPTSNAELGRIVTAPDGNLWFLMEDANKVGRITPGGQIQEFSLPPTDSDVEGPAIDLDVSPDGTVWVTTEHGSNLTRLSSNGAVLNNWVFPYDDGCPSSCPYGGDVRVGPDGAAWVTMNFGDSFIVKVTPSGQLIDPLNAPACDDVLGEAADGSMWCQGGEADEQDTIVHVNGDAAGGVTYPLPQDATYPRALTAGPVGSIWFTRNSGGTWFTSADSGSVGYLDQATGATHIWSTGSRSAPEDLVRGPDDNMWFTNVGAEPGIGHISAGGVGVISKVGNYQPTSLTFGPDGAVWFTDNVTNSIVRVTTDQLQTNTVDLGGGVTMTPPNTAVPPPPGTADGGAAGTLTKIKKPLAVKRNAFRVPIACPATMTAGCAGRLSVETAKKVRKPGAKKGKKATRAVVRQVGYKVPAGTSSTVKVKLTKTGRALVRGRTKVRAELTAVGATKPSASRTLTVRR